METDLKLVRLNKKLMMIEWKVKTFRGSHAEFHTSLFIATRNQSNIYHFVLFKLAH